MSVCLCGFIILVTLCCRLRGPVSVTAGRARTPLPRRPVRTSSPTLSTCWSPAAVVPTHWVRLGVDGTGRCNVLEKPGNKAGFQRYISQRNKIKSVLSLSLSPSLTLSLPLRWPCNPPRECLRGGDEQATGYSPRCGVPVHMCSQRRGCWHQTSLLLPIQG